MDAVGIAGVVFGAVGVVISVWSEVRRRREKTAAEAARDVFHRLLVMLKPAMLGPNNKT
jgi:hypothetical protein